LESERTGIWSQLAGTFADAPPGILGELTTTPLSENSIGLYDAAVIRCIRQLGALAGDKAAAHCAANKIEESALLQDRQYPEMFSPGRQIRQSADSPVLDPNWNTMPWRSLSPA
jgi:Domain of unknown function (DUF1993)